MLMCPDALVRRPRPGGSRYGRCGPAGERISDNSAVDLVCAGVELCDVGGPTVYPGRYILW